MRPNQITNLSPEAEALLEQKMRKEDRILVIEPIDGKPKSTWGNTDPRLFHGNDLHAIHGTEDNLWRLKYDFGILPEPLKQKFTSFSKLKNYVEAYYNRRNIVIKEVLD